MQLRTIYRNTHVYTFHVCLCLIALTFVCNSTYLLKLEVQRYDSTQHDALKALSQQAQEGEDRIPAGPRALLSWFQSWRKGLGRFNRFEELNK